MPELSRFFGIVIRMFVEAGEPHHRAEIHRAELASDWALLQSGQPPVKIDPLR